MPVGARKYCRCHLTNGASAARALAAAAAQPRNQYKARRLPQIERALDSCMRWLGSTSQLWEQSDQKSNVFCGDISSALDKLSNADPFALKL